MDDAELLQMIQRLDELKLEHRDLDDAIRLMIEQAAYIDQLQLTRMKKRKLLLKDAIDRLESKLIPDMNA